MATRAHAKKTGLNMTISKPNYHLEIFRMWRGSILRYHPNAFVGKPNVLQSGYCKRIKSGFCGFFSEEELPQFIDRCIGQFGPFCSWADKHYCRFNFPLFPDLRYMDKNLHIFLNWYGAYKTEHSIKPIFTLVSSHD